MAGDLANDTIEAGTAERGALLGEFLRARRDGLRPQDLGLPVGVRRRAPGLRREEAAQLCGISPTWYTWLEQGRITGVSVATLAAIARGLRLSRAERNYLFQLAARADP
jgi:transcriptional regulator with XRE-family HTH domain